MILDEYVRGFMLLRRWRKQKARLLNQPSTGVSGVVRTAGGILLGMNLVLLVMIYIGYLFG